MRDHVGRPADPPEQVTSPTIVLLRRAAAVAGFLFGLGLLALLGAGQASADEPAEPAASHQAAPVTGVVRDVVAPLAEPVDQLATPVVRPVSKAAAKVVVPVIAPVVEPVTTVVRPVVRSLAPVVDAVVDAVAPAVEPLTGPLLAAADPVVAPVARAVGAQDAVSGLSGDHAAAPPRHPAPAGVPTVHDTVPTVSSVSSVRPAVAAASPASGDGRGAWLAGSGRPDDRPGVPPGQDAVPGGAVSGGSVGQHGADGTTPSESASSDVDSEGARAPPGGTACMSWLAFDDRDHPS